MRTSPIIKKYKNNRDVFTLKVYGGIIASAPR